MIPQGGIFDLQHTQITCVQFSTIISENTHDARAILLYNDSRNPAQFPPMLVLIQWKRIQDNHIRTTIIPYNTYTPAVMEDAPHHYFTIKIDNDHAMGNGYLAYNVDPGALPHDHAHATELARICHTRMQEKQQQYVHIIDMLRATIRHQLHQLYPNGINNQHNKLIDTVFIYNGYIYAEDYLAIRRAYPIASIHVDQLPDIALRMDSNTLQHFDGSYGDLPFLNSYVLYPIPKLYIYVPLNNHVSQHERVQEYRQDQETANQLQQKTGPITTYPAPPSPNPPATGCYYP